MRNIYIDDFDMAPFQTAVNIRQESVENLGQDIIDLHILPGEENWAENTTAITGNTSERSESIDGVNQWPKYDETLNVTCNRYIAPIFAIIIIACAFLSPLIMIVLPKLGFVSKTLSVLSTQQKLTYALCNIECKGQLLGLGFKVTLLGIGSWAIFVKKREAFMPRLYMFRSGVIILTSLCICTFWLFYIVQITEGAKSDLIGDLAEYKSLVNYAGNFVDTLLFIHYVAVLLFEIRHLKPIYYLKVIRSPDGVSKSYAIGQLSIQRAAIWILEKYYTEFSIYNPYLERLPISKSGKKHSNNFKFYNVDDDINNIEQSYSDRTVFESERTILANHARRRDSSHNERFYEEHEYNRRVRKRKARLITAAEEAFAHIQRVNIESGRISNLLDPMQAAQSVFPSMARVLQKYLRITRQQPRHSIETILQRLAYCLAQDATPRAFLEPFFNTSPILSCEKEKQQNSQHWALVCDGALPSRPIASGCEFQLRQGEIALLCSVHRLPHFHLTEQVTLPKSNKFLLKFNSEIPT